MARIHADPNDDVSESDDELPSLDEMLGKPHAALAPTSHNAPTRSPAKTAGKRQSPRKQTKDDCKGHGRSASASFEHVSFSKPSLPPTAELKSPAKRTAARSPGKCLKDTQKTGSSDQPAARWQRAPKSPVKGQGLLFEPLKPEPGTSDRAKSATRRRIQKPLDFAVDDDSEHTCEISEEFDIFKGSGIHRKTPRRVAKKRVAYREGHDGPGQDERHNESVCESAVSIWSAGSPSETSIMEENGAKPRRRHEELDDDFLSLKLKGLTLEKPTAREASRQEAKTSIKPGQSPRKVQEAPNKNTRPSSSHSTQSGPDDRNAILRFSPPSSPSPSCIPPTPTTPNTTPPPPASPGKLKSPSKLKSPTKLQSARVPAARPSLDGVWAQDVVNDYNDERSPIKPFTSPRKKHLQDFFANHSDDEDSTLLPSSPSTSSPRKKGAAPTSQSRTEAAASKAEKSRLKAFNAQKDALARAFLAQLDARITHGAIARLTASTGGVQISWSRKLNTTAGRANWRRERHVPSAQPQAPTAEKQDEHRHVASIELAAKVVTTPARLHNVLAHEFCHLANFMLSRELKAPHGPSFQAWARKTTAEFGGSHGVQVSTRHEYAIDYKYVWVCENSFCATEYKRHSRSVDVARHTCGRCRGGLVQVCPKPRGGGRPEKGVGGGYNGGSGCNGGSEYNAFVKAQWASVRGELPPGSPAKDVMREVAVRYRERKEEGARVEVVEVGDVKEEEGVEDVARRLDFFRI